LEINEFRKRDVKLPVSQLIEIMDTLERASWIHLTANGRWMLFRDMASLTLMDLYRIMPNRMPLNVNTLPGHKDSNLLKELLQQQQQGPYG